MFEVIFYAFFSILFIWLPGAALTSKRLLSFSREHLEIAESDLALAKKHEQLSKQTIDIARKHMGQEQIAQIAERSGIRELRFQPELRTNETFQKLMDQLEGLNNEREELRKTHNNCADRYNTFIASLQAKLFLWPRREPYWYGEKIDWLGPTGKIEEALQKQFEAQEKISAES